jgi:hypothetical protein
MTLTRILNEGFGAGAWHGADLKAALSDVTPDLAFWRPAAGRHNIAEIALHHAYAVRNVIGKLTNRQPEPFVLDGDDWFEVDGHGRLKWAEIRAVVDAGQERLATAVAAAPANGEAADLVLGITCHAIYHAGQVQLIKRLNENVAA